MEGWIKLHRQLLEWEWYDEPDTFRLFLHCLLKANHKDNNYRGQIVKAGSFLTSRELLSNETGLSIQKVRTSLERLELTKEITTKKSKKGTVLQIVKYKNYQGTNQEDNQQNNQQFNQIVTNEQPTVNQIVTTNNNDKKEKNENKNKLEASQIKSFKDKILSEVEQRNIVSKAKDEVEKRGGKWVCDYNFNPYDVLSRQFTNFNKICVDGKWTFNDVNHIKNSFYKFVVEYWEFNYDTIISKRKTKFKKQYTKK